VFLTDQTDSDVAVLELRHRQRARVEDRIRGAKATGLASLPFDRWRRNTVWLELVLAAQDLTAWAQRLLLDGALAVAEPKTLRYRLWHVAARIVRHAAGSSCACNAPGHGPSSSPGRSPGCGPCRCAAEPPAAPTTRPPTMGHAGMPTSRHPGRRPAQQPQHHPGQPANRPRTRPPDPTATPNNRHSRPHEKPRLAPLGMG
jgi:hypothetical protein